MPGGLAPGAFRGVGGDPLFIERAEGPYLFDADGNRAVDYVLSWGPLILGHAISGGGPRRSANRPGAARATRADGAGDRAGGAGHRSRALGRDGALREFRDRGDHAALRLARAYTGRNKIVKFEGCYHGHADMLLVQAGSGVATLGLPDSPGVPPGATADTSLRHLTTSARCVACSSASRRDRGGHR